VNHRTFSLQAHSYSCWYRLLASSCLSVHPSFLKYHLVSHWTGFSLNLLLDTFIKIGREKSRFWLKWVENIEHFSWRPGYLYIVDSSTKYFVPWRQCKHGNTRMCKCIIVSVRALNSFMLLAATWLNNTKGVNCCVLKEHFQYFLVMFSVIHVTQPYTEEALLLFPWQQWLH